MYLTEQDRLRGTINKLIGLANNPHSRRRCLVRYFTTVGNADLNHDFTGWNRRGVEQFQRSMDGLPNYLRTGGQLSFEDEVLFLNLATLAAREKIRWKGYRVDGAARVRVTELSYLLPPTPAALEIAIRFAYECPALRPKLGYSIAIPLAQLRGPSPGLTTEEVETFQRRFIQAGTLDSLTSAFSLMTELKKSSSIRTYAA